MKNFLAHKPSTLSKELNEDFNNQRLWAKHYISCYKDYMTNSSQSIPIEQKKQVVSPRSNNNPSQIFLQRSSEEINVEIPPLKNTFNKKRVLKDTTK